MLQKFFSFDKCDKVRRILIKFFIKILADNLWIVSVNAFSFQHRLGYFILT